MAVVGNPHACHAVPCRCCHCCLCLLQLAAGHTSLHAHFSCTSTAPLPPGGDWPAPRLPLLRRGPRRGLHRGALRCAVLCCAAALCWAACWAGLCCAGLGWAGLGRAVALAMQHPAACNSLDWSSQLRSLLPSPDRALLPWPKLMAAVAAFCRPQANGTLGEVFDVISKSDMVVLLISDAAQVRAFERHCGTIAVQTTGVVSVHGRAAHLRRRPGETRQGCAQLHGLPVSLPAAQWRPASCSPRLPRLMRQADLHDGICA